VARPYAACAVSHVVHIQYSVAEIQHGCQSVILSRIIPRIERVYPTSEVQNTRFHENLFKTFRVIPLVDKRTDEHRRKHNLIGVIFSTINCYCLISQR